MTNMSNTAPGLDSEYVLDARQTDGPITLIKVHRELEAAPAGATLTVLTAEDDAELNLRSFCNSTRHLYLGCDRLMGHDVHWIKKSPPPRKCQRCSNIRTMLAGAVILPVLAYTGPQVVAGGADHIVTLLFALSVCALPPVAYENYRLAKRGLLRLIDPHDG